MSEFARSFRGWLCLILLSASLASAQQTTFTPAASIGKADAPVILCIDDKPAVGGRPTSAAYAKAAANGFRSVLTLRSPGDGVDINRERFMVEQAGMRYFNIPATGKLPERKKVDAFLALVRDRANHPMLLNCALTERIAPFMMIFRIKEQGWTEKRAVEEGAQSGLKADALTKFARDYFAASKKPAG